MPKLMTVSGQEHLSSRQHQQQPNLFIIFLPRSMEIMFMVLQLLHHQQQHNRCLCDFKLGMQFHPLKFRTNSEFKVPL